MAPRRKLCVNQPVIDRLEEELRVAGGVNLTRAFRRAITNIRKEQQVLLTKRDAQKINGVGDYIANIIHDFLLENPPPVQNLPVADSVQPHPDSNIPRSETQRKHDCSPGIADDPIKHCDTSLAQCDGVSQPRSTGTKRRRRVDEAHIGPANTKESAPKRKHYIPRVQSAAAALLIALLNAKENGEHRLRKEDLASRAQKNCSEPILKVQTGDPQHFYHGWSCMKKQLTKHAYVIRYSSPAWYCLTPEGEHAARVCLDQLQSIERRTLIQYGGPSVPPSNPMPLQQDALPAGQPLENAYVSRKALFSSRASSPERVPQPSIASDTSGDLLATSKQTNRGSRVQQRNESNSNNESDQSREHQHVEPLGSNRNNEESRVTFWEQQHVTERMKKQIGTTGKALLLPSAVGSECLHVPIIGISEAGCSESQQEKNTPAAQDDVPRLLHLGQDSGVKSKITKLQCERATRVIERLEAQGSSREDLLMIVDSMVVAGKFPKTDDAAWTAVTDMLWEIEKADRVDKRKNHEMDLRISSIPLRKPEICPKPHPPPSGAPEILSVDSDGSELEKDGEVSKCDCTECQLIVIGDDEDSVIDLVDDENDEVPSIQEFHSRSRQDPSESEEIIILDGDYGSCRSEEGQDETIYREKGYASPSRRSNVEEVQSSSLNAGPIIPDSHVVYIASDEDSKCDEDAECDEDLDCDEDSECVLAEDKVKYNQDLQKNSPEPYFVPNRQERTGKRSVYVSKANVQHSREGIDRDSGSLRGSNSPNVGRSFSPKLTSLSADETENQLSSTKHSPPNREDETFQSTLLPNASPAEPNIAIGQISHQGCKIVLIVDSMERLRRNDSRSTHSDFADMLGELNIAFDIRSLPCGDALFAAQFEDGTEVVMDYIVERKTVGDFGGSMNDGRISRQAYLLRHSGVPNRLVVIEGSLKANTDIYSQPRMHNKLAELEVCSDVYVKRTSNLADTLHFYRCMARRLEYKFRHSNKEMTMRGRTRFAEWKQCMQKLKRRASLEQLFMMQLCWLPRIGKGRSAAILNMGYKTPRALFRGFQEKKSMSEKESMLNVPGSGVGAEASMIVAQLFNLPVYR